MKKIKLVFLAIVLSLILVIGFAGCSNDTKGLEDRITDLETKLETLKEEMDFRAAARAVNVGFYQNFGDKYFELYINNLDSSMFESVTNKFTTNDIEILEEKPDYLSANATALGDYEFEMIFKSKTGNFTLTRNFPFTLR